ncbi:hypothetical protein Kfla_6603 [Kribbella flavida DSM 17836]|uniref:Uncharacterized protein n=1 Tax=Kribbella flavida (strain DSM 17836 / JCM 10339 / NBRC 14399) TaxID=479435 RepID=D2PZM9_KRIFD|nr:hypothetical protein [Kribbella flavida]ADB35595.1 hypothetical protein Kfla_6603 [Kribbella flavida DSM 17836]
MLQGILATAAGLALVTHPLPAAAAATVDGVTIAWSDTTHTKIRITWTESTPVANTLRFQSGAHQLDLGATTAAQPNEVLINTSHLGSSAQYDEGRIVVSSTGGGEASSPAFDRFLPGIEPALNFAADGRWTWRDAHFLPADTTPDDPLDLDLIARYTPRLLVDQEPRVLAGCGVIEGPNTSTTTGPVPAADQAAALVVRSVNEWGRNGRYGFSLPVTTATMSLTAPTSTPYGAPLVLTGRSMEKRITFTPTTGSCSIADRPLDGTRLEARDSSTGPWYLVGTLPQQRGDGNVTATLVNRGAREFRLHQPEILYSRYVDLGAASAVRAVRTTTRVVSAKFIQPAITAGTRPQAYLWVDPAGTQKAALQFKNASGVWQGLTYQTLSAGRGLVAFSWNARGTFQFRWWVPGSTGPTVDAVYSPVFTLTVR